MLIPWILGYIDSMRNRVLSPNLILLLCYFLFLAPVVLFAQEERLDLTAELVGKDLKPGESFKIKVGLLVKEGFYTYPTTQKDKNAEAFVTTVRVKGGEAAPVERRGEVKEPAGKEKFDSTLNIVITIYDKPVELEVPFVVKEKTPAGPAKFTLSVVTQVCDDGSCLPVSKSFDFEIHVQGNAESGTSGQVGTIEKSEKIPGSTEAKSSRSASSGLETPQEARDQTLLSFMLTGVGFGFITLLTPCVFPMIPITVSFFLKQNKTGTEAITNALVYTLTIVVALSLFAYLAVSFFQQLTQMGITNLILAALFMYFALSLFGAYEITLPSFLTRWTAAGEAQGGYLGTIFMAMTFTIISFSCVAPFMGFFAGATASARPMSWNLLGALSFSLAFASPFFLLALFPSWLKALPKSGSWMNTLKVVMGFLEVAAAIKFLRTAEILWKKGNPEYLTYDIAMGLYVTICLLCGLYLLGVFRLPHDDHHEGQNRIGVGRLMWSMLFLGLGFYLLPALFRGPDGEKMRPVGVVYDWIDAFLLPAGDTKPIEIAFRGQHDSSTESRQKWITFIPEALQQARLKKQRIFVDFTGVSCTNCLLNERSYFSQPQVKAEFAKYTLLKLYTDTVPLEHYSTEQVQDTSKAVEDRQIEDAEENKRFQRERFNTSQLPMYAIIEPEGNDFRIVARYPLSVIRDVEDFAGFLRQHATYQGN